MTCPAHGEHCNGQHHRNRCDTCGAKSRAERSHQACGLLKVYVMKSDACKDEVHGACRGDAYRQLTDEDNKSYSQREPCTCQCHWYHR